MIQTQESSKQKQQYSQTRIKKLPGVNHVMASSQTLATQQDIDQGHQLCEYPSKFKKINKQQDLKNLGQIRQTEYLTQTQKQLQNKISSQQAKIQQFEAKVQQIQEQGRKKDALLDKANKTIKKIKQEKFVTYNYFNTIIHQQSKIGIKFDRQEKKERLLPTNVTASMWKNIGITDQRRIAEDSLSKTERQKMVNKLNQYPKQSQRGVYFQAKHLQIGYRQKMKQQQYEKTIENLKQQNKQLTKQFKQKMQQKSIQIEDLKAKIKKLQLKNSDYDQLANKINEARRRIQSWEGSLLEKSQLQKNIDNFKMELNSLGEQLKNKNEQLVIFRADILTLETKMKSKAQILNQNRLLIDEKKRSKNSYDLFVQYFLS